MRMLQSLRAMAIAVVALVAAGPAAALTADERSALDSISKRFSTVRTMNGEFVQFGPDGSRTEGKFYIARPGKVRFQYDKPSTISVIADGKSVLVHDKKLRTYDIWPLSKTPLKYLLDSSIDLATFDKVKGVSLESDLVQVVIVDDSKFGGGRLTLIFDRTSNELRQWTVTDEQGLETSVALYNVESGRDLGSDLFKINYAAATNAAQDAQRR